MFHITHAVQTFLALLWPWMFAPGHRSLPREYRAGGRPSIFTNYCRAELWHDDFHVWLHNLEQHLAGPEPQAAALGFNEGSDREMLYYEAVAWWGGCRGEYNLDSSPLLRYLYTLKAVICILLDRYCMTAFNMQGRGVQVAAFNAAEVYHHDYGRACDWEVMEVGGGLGNWWVIIHSDGYP